MAFDAALKAEEISGESESEKSEDEEEERELEPELERELEKNVEVDEFVEADTDMESDGVSFFSRTKKLRFEGIFYMKLCLTRAIKITILYLLIS